MDGSFIAIIDLYSLSERLFEFHISFAFLIFFNAWLLIGLILIAGFYTYKLNYNRAFLIGVMSLISFLAYNIIISTYAQEVFIPTYPTTHLTIFYVILFNLIFLYASKVILIKSETVTIKKNILDLGVKFTRLNVGDIAERCSINQEKIRRVVTEMIKNREIYAIYQKRKKIIVFQQEININEIENLMKVYDEWENDFLK